MSKTMRALVKTKAAPRHGDARGAGSGDRPQRRPHRGRDGKCLRAPTDLHIYHWDEWAQARIKPPYVPGHEFCGTVVAVGAAVQGIAQGIAIGDFVSAEMHVACGHCLQCRSGQGARLPVRQDPRRRRGRGLRRLRPHPPPATSGSWTPPSRVTSARSSTPSATPSHTVLSGAIAGQTVAVTGCGPIGLFAIAVAKACGAAKVFAIEPNAPRRAPRRHDGRAGRPGLPPTAISSNR